MVDINIQADEDRDWVLWWRFVKLLRSRLLIQTLVRRINIKEHHTGMHYWPFGCMEGVGHSPTPYLGAYPTTCWAPSSYVTGYVTVYTWNMESLRTAVSNSDHHFKKHVLDQFVPSVSQSSSPNTIIRHFRTRIITRLYRWVSARLQ